MNNQLIKKIIGIFFISLLFIRSYASESNVCNAVATFDTETGELKVPCLIVDGNTYYEVSLNQRTSSTFTLGLYNHLGNDVHLTPEIDPVWNSEKNQYVTTSSTNNWDKNSSDDFDGNFQSLSNKPTKLSEFDNDLNLDTIPQGYGFLAPRQNSPCPPGFTYKTVHFEVGNSNNANVGGCFKN